MATNFLQQSINDSPDYAIRISKMYPNIYNALMPYVDYTVDTYGQQHNLDNTRLNELIYEIISSSNIMNQLPHGYSKTRINDIVKVLLLTAIYNKYHEDPTHNPYNDYPYPSYPYSYQPQAIQQPPAGSSYGYPPRVPISNPSFSCAF